MQSCAYWYKGSTETQYLVGQGIRSEKLSIANKEKRLGCLVYIIYTGLKFSSHIDRAVVKSNQLGYLDSSRDLLFTRISSQWNYCRYILLLWDHTWSMVILWHPMYKKDIY